MRNFSTQELDENYSSMITKPLMNMIVDQSVLSGDGHHSLDHWVRVLTNGRKLAELTGANLKVVEGLAAGI